MASQAKALLMMEQEVIRALGPMEKYNQSSPFEFETIFEGREELLLEWAIKNWHWSIYASIIYIVALFSFKRFMSNRNRLDMRPLLAVWSGILAVFSIFGTYRMLPEVIHSIKNYSVYQSICNPNFYDGVSGFWTLAFVLSKPWELGDTLFIVLRKQPLIFLHWYHHMSVMIYTAYSYTRHDAAARWGITMNYFVHAIMYSYYTLRALRFRVPRQVNIVVTGLQISQMIVGTTVSFYLVWTRIAGITCHSDDFSAVSGLLMYISYLILFGHFFYSTYVKKSSKKDA